MKIPEVGTEEDYLKQGPGFIFGYHPALGPLYEVIAQKVRGGILHAGAELNLEITEVDIENLELQGSLLIEGDINLSRCILKSVQVVNRGIDRAAPNIYWKREVARLESLGITLEGHAEFYAENVVFQGDLQITILDGETARCHHARRRAPLRTHSTKKTRSFMEIRFRHRKSYHFE